jgi:hypothetical protein
MNRWLYILVSVTVLASCSADKVYNLESLNTDIAEFDDADQKRIVEFSNRYEKGKSFYDSIDGVPVVLVQSLTYKELLHRIKSYEYRQEQIRSEFSWRVVRQLGTMSEQVDTLRLSSFDKPVILFTQRELQLPTEIRIGEGRGFSELLDKGKDVVVMSKSIADMLNLQLDDTIRLDKVYKIIGITTDIEIIKPYNPTLFAIKSKL